MTTFSSVHVLSSGFLWYSVCMLRGDARTLRRVCRVGATTACLAVLFGAATGYYLAGHPNVGGWSGSRETIHNNLGGTFWGNDTFIRTPEGVRKGGMLSDPSGSVVLGAANYTVACKAVAGWPHATVVECSIKVGNIRPAPDGPPAEDGRAWRAIVAAALSAEFRTEPCGLVLPADALRGDEHARGRVPWAFQRNMAARMIHAPWLSAACVMCALVIALLPEIARRCRSARRRSSGRCAACGYPADGLVRSMCPECGTALSDISGRPSELGAPRADTLR
jgi:hypothetical protein